MTAHTCIKEEEFGNIWSAVRKVNGWKFGFWTLGIIVTLLFPTLCGYVIANDRIRATEDQRLDDKFQRAIDEQNKSMSIMMSDIREIKTIVSMLRNEKVNLRQ